MNGSNQILVYCNRVLKCDVAKRLELRQNWERMCRDITAQIANISITPKLQKYDDFWQAGTFRHPISNISSNPINSLI